MDEKKHIMNLKKRNRCYYMEAWIGFCERPISDGHDLCNKHRGIQCGNRGCNNEAIGQCDHADSLVCGKPICKSCFDKDGDSCQYHATTYKNGKQEYKYPKMREW